MNLQKIRMNIDQIDTEILKLLNERIELALRTRKFKEAIHDRDREELVLSQLKNYSNILNLIQNGFVEKLFKQIMTESRKIQKKPRRLIGFQGEHGAFGEMAARHLDKNLVTIPCPGFADVFEGVEKGYLDLGIVPVENSLGGAVTQVNESLLKTDLKVVSAVVFQIKHCLLILPNTNYREIRMVYSHPQALSQCREFLQRQNLEARPYYDTAGAAKMLFKEKPRMAGTIASKLAAELYNLDVIKENVEDNPMNFTRFLILSKEEKKQNANKCSIVFATPHKSGSLFAVLKIFKEARINLTRIESLPHREAPGNYVFFLDFQSKDLTSGISDVLSEVKKNTKMFKYLGCYKEEISQ